MTSGHTQEYTANSSFRSTFGNGVVAVSTAACPDTVNSTEQSYATSPFRNPVSPVGSQGPGDPRLQSNGTHPTTSLRPQ